MPNDQRHYAIAIAPDGREVEVGAIREISREAAIYRYFEADIGSTDSAWYADGFFESQRLAVETREKRNGKWVAIHRTAYSCPKLREAHERVLNANRPRSRRRISDMATEATALAL